MAEPAEKLEEQEPAPQGEDAGDDEFTPVDITHLTGAEKAAILLLALGSEFGQPIWKELDDDEVHLRLGWPCRRWATSTRTSPKPCCTSLSRKCHSPAL